MAIKNDEIFIIGEIGVNHNGDVNIALKMIEKLAEIGANCAKFQIFRTESLVILELNQSPYQLKNTKKIQSQYEMLKKLELSNEEHILLKNKCESLGLVYLASPFDLESIDFLQQIGVKYFKIASGEITNLPLLIKIGKTGKPVIISTGMSNLEEIESAFNALKKYGSKDIYILHTTTAYPTKYNEVNLLAMLTLKKKFGDIIGYSDHTDGIIIPTAAVALGAKMIEKHVTLDRVMEGPDHAASIDFSQFREMVKNIRNISVALGDGDKKPSISEMENIYYVRKSIVAKNPIFKGEVLNEENMTVKRHGDGVSPMKWFEVIGKIAVKDYQKDELIIF